MTTTRNGFLDDVYELATPNDTKALYRDWAESYDAELTSQGYISPARCASALRDAAEDPAAPVLDLGCGTGLSGEALRDAGFSSIDGADFSQEMLEAARSKGVYRNVIRSDLERPLPGAPGDYTHISAVGVFSPGHAPPDLIFKAMRHLPSGGCMVFTFNDHALADRGYEGALREMVDCGGAELIFKEHGPHVPGIGLEATVYLLAKR